jgi:hypothetical protein
VVNNTLNKWANEPNRQFSKEEVQMSNKHTKKFSTSLAIKEMQIKTTLRFYLTLVKMGIINNTNNDRCWGGCGGKGTLLHCWQAMESNMEVPQKPKKEPHFLNR